MAKGIPKTSLISKIYILKHPAITFFSILILFFSAFVKAESYAVASRHHLATDIGIKILDEGGNAIDAAIAVAQAAVPQAFV